MNLMKFDEFQSLSAIEKSIYLEENFQANARSMAKRKPIYGVGINDSPYMTQVMISGGRACCPAYSCWSSMMQRAMGDVFKKKNKTYHGVSVCDDWLTFSKFKSWWILNVIDGWQLDKDIIGNGKLYSPDSCIFVPGWLNKFTSSREACRGELPIGVSLHKKTGKFKAECCQRDGSRGYVGLYSTKELAAAAWKSRKLDLAKEYKSDMDAISGEIYSRVVAIIMNS